MTAGSSSGSKYYDLVPRQQSYIANRWQQDVPTYSVIDITDTTFTINTYRTDTEEKIDETFSIAKVMSLKIKIRLIIRNSRLQKRKIQPNQLKQQLHQRKQCLRK
mgnify:CR=1 FL=1